MSVHSILTFGPSAFSNVPLALPTMACGMGYVGKRSHANGHGSLRIPRSERSEQECQNDGS